MGERDHRRHTMLQPYADRGWESATGGALRVVRSGALLCELGSDDA
jgi:hypothetical protein